MNFISDDGAHQVRVMAVVFIYVYLRKCLPCNSMSFNDNYLLRLSKKDSYVKFTTLLEASWRSVVLE